MCLFKPSAGADPKMPPEYASMKQPTARDTAMAGTKMKDRLRAQTSTLLTGTTGVGSTDTYGKKVLLGS